MDDRRSLSVRNPTPSPGLLRSESETMRSKWPCHQRRRLEPACDAALHLGGLHPCEYERINGVGDEVCGAAVSMPIVPDLLEMPLYKEDDAGGGSASEGVQGRAGDFEPTGGAFQGAHPLYCIKVDTQLRVVRLLLSFSNAVLIQRKLGHKKRDAGGLVFPAQGRRSFRHPMEQRGQPPWAPEVAAEVEVRCRAQGPLTWSIIAPPQRRA